MNPYIRISPQSRARLAFIQAVVIPVITALIAAVATLAAPIVSSSFPPQASTSPAKALPSKSNSTTSPSKSTVDISPKGSVTIQNAGSNTNLAECAIYEQDLLVPLARLDLEAVDSLLNSDSPINRTCGLSP